MASLLEKENQTASHHYLLTLNIQMILVKITTSDKLQTHSFAHGLVPWLALAAQSLARVESAILHSCSSVLLFHCDSTSASHHVVKTSPIQLKSILLNRLIFHHISSDQPHQLYGWKCVARDNRVGQGEVPSWGILHMDQHKSTVNPHPQSPHLFSCYWIIRNTDICHKWLNNSDEQQ